ncbi:MAG: CPBP family intramembrane metalloprotease [Candidatus Omnitrophica bacterium]|nr:CPBP family intramembrane metalloprotease [Candidatus Omnitrophota bacterium]
MREISKTLLKFLIGFVVVVIISAFLAPLLYQILPFKFDRILRRLIMIGTVILMIGLVRARRESLGKLGLGWNDKSLPLMVKGFLGGMAFAIVVSLIQWGIGARIWRLHQTDVWHWIGLFLKGFGGGMLIGLIEECFFRGFLFVTLKDFWNTKGSLILTNVIYAVSHFFPKNKPIIGAEPTMWDSFRHIGAIAYSPWESPERIVAMLGLFLFGLLLSLVYLRAGTLFPSIGIHAGAVFSLKMNRRFIGDISEKMNMFSGSKNLYDGVVGLTILSITCLVLSFWPKNERRL